MDNPFDLIWRGEVIDVAQDMQTARFLQGEYSSAYGGAVTIKRVRNRCPLCDDAIRLDRQRCSDCESDRSV